MKEEREKRKNSRPPSRLFSTTDQDTFNDTLDENLSIPSADDDIEKEILNLDEDLAILTPDKKSSVDDNINKEIHDQSLQFVNEDIRY